MDAMHRFAFTMLAGLALPVAAKAETTPVQAFVSAVNNGDAKGCILKA
jgi:hypothetical protein